MLFQRIPCAAAGTTAYPLWSFIAAGRTVKYSLRLSQTTTSLLFFCNYSNKPVFGQVFENKNCPTNVGQLNYEEN
jgi:hypothetical protein